MGFFKVGQVILPVKDPSKSVFFYGDTLGMKVKQTNPEEFAFFDGGGIELVLHQIVRAAPPDPTEIVQQVPDVQATFQAFKAKGVHFSYPPRAVTGDGSSELYATDFRDPDGHVLSITSWVKK
jgi:catechol 2,3-dioxygenase-like lactoylglutathione lyase family enzyme